MRGTSIMANSLRVVQTIECAIGRSYEWLIDSRYENGHLLGKYAIQTSQKYRAEPVRELAFRTRGSESSKLTDRGAGGTMTRESNEAATRWPSPCSRVNEGLGSGGPR